MQSLGGFMVLIGAGSFVLRLMNIDFMIISWVDRWGEGVGNGIRIGLIVVGAILWYLGNKSARQGTQETPPAT